MSAVLSVFLVDIQQCFVISSIESVSVIQGSARRKKKVLHKTTVGDDKKLQTSLKKLGLNPIPSIEEVFLDCGFSCRYDVYENHIYSRI